MKPSVARSWAAYDCPEHVCDGGGGVGWKSIVCDEWDVGGVAWLCEWYSWTVSWGEAANRRVNPGPRTGFRLVWSDSVLPVSLGTRLDPPL